MNCLYIFTLNTQLGTFLLSKAKKDPLPNLKRIFDIVNIIPRPDPWT